MRVVQVKVGGVQIVVRGVQTTVGGVLQMVVRGVQTMVGGVQTTVGILHVGVDMRLGGLRVQLVQLDRVGIERRVVVGNRTMRGRYQAARPTIAATTTIATISAAWIDRLDFSFPGFSSSVIFPSLFRSILFISTWSPR